MKRILALAALAAGVAAAAASIAPFSAAEPGAALPAGWRLIALPRLKPPEAALVRDGGAVVLRLHAPAAAGSVGHDVSVDGDGATLAWRWKVDRVVEKADMARKEGDDFAARMYVTFDLPSDELPFVARTKLAIARALYGSSLPSAALCYVWDNRHPPGTTAWNPYSAQMRMVVLRSGPALAGQWVAESRDLGADFRAAFGERGGAPVPKVTGVAVGIDTDQTLETATAWFGDVRLEPRR